MDKQRVKWSAGAKLDLISILEFYHKRNGTKTYSIKLNSNFRKAIKLIAKYPTLGMKTDVLNIRMLIEGNYSIFYQIKEKEIEIVNIWDCRRNLNVVKR